jgi:hypothetical protein
VGQIIQLDATYRFGSTSEPSDADLRWSSSDPASFAIDSLGGGHALAYTGVPVTITASSRGAAATTQVFVVPAFDSLVVTLSATLAQGRTVRPTLAIQGRDLYAYYADFPELPRLAVLESSNPQVLSIDATGAVHANALGRATVTGRLTDRTTSVVVDVIAGYGATYVEGTDGMRVNGVNDGGDVIGTLSTGANVLIRQGTTTNLGQCQPKAINDADQIACVVGYKSPGLYFNGTLTTPFDAAAGEGTGITEAGALFGRVAGSDGVTRMFVWTPSGVTYRSALSGSTFSVNSALSGVAVDNALYSNSFIARASEDVGLTPAGGRWSDARDINDAEDVVGTSERMSNVGNPGGRATIWRAATAWKPENPSYRAADATAISESGQVVGSGADGAYVWRDGRYTILTDALADAGWTLTSAPAISRNGKVAAIGQHTSGRKGVVLIDLGTSP